MSSYVLKIASGTYSQELGIIKEVVTKRITNKTIIPTFSTSEEQQVLTLGVTKREFVISGRFTGTESEIDDFIYNINSAETDPSTSNGDSKQCYLFVRNDRITTGINSSPLTNKLRDLSNNFTTTGVLVGMYAVNDTLNRLANITNVDDAFTLSLSADIFQNSGYEYTIYENVILCFIYDFQFTDTGGAPGYIDYQITLKEGEPLNTA